MDFLIWFILCVAFLNNFDISNAAVKIELPENDMKELIRNETHLGDFKYVVAIVFKDAVCTGAILNDNYVVTAGHCFVNETGDFENESATVVAGTHDMNDTDTQRKIEIKVEKVYVPATYYRKKYWKLKKSLPPHDMAILKLATSLNISQNENLEAVILPLKNSTEKYANTTAVIAGYGYNNVSITKEYDGSKHKEFTSDDKLHWANIVVMKNDDCLEDHYVTIDDAQMCAHMKDNSSEIFGTCGGDSGAPLVYTSKEGSKILIGVQTGVRGCNEARHPALYTRVIPHVEFIERVLQGKADSNIARETTLPTVDVAYDNPSTEMTN